MWEFLTKKEINSFIGTCILLFFILATFVPLHFFSKKFPSFPEKTLQKIETGNTPVFHLEPKPWSYAPIPISMEKIKTKGCIADGILSGYGEDIPEATKLINRSECVYLHRALETWLEPPDFQKASEIMRRIKKNDIVYGMFIAEALKTNEDYFFPKEKRNFEFSKMCRPGSKNFWGEHTCKPSFQKKEYRRYLEHITQEAMDLGIQSFMFGQIKLQDESHQINPEILEIISSMRAYAKKKSMSIIIGAQTNDIENEAYLKLFDYVEGGVGIDENGKIENGPCHTRWWKKEGDWCWALLWNEKFSSKANNIFLHLDWNGSKYDDMGIFSRMSQSDRKTSLEQLHLFFTQKNMGFLMPFLSTIHRENGGCYGPKKRFYSPSNKYKCKDENFINAILKKTS